MRIVLRDQWAERSPREPFVALRRRRVKGVVVHHGGVREAPAGVAALLAFERHHMDERGWNAIAYNWLVDEAGVIYEGRGAGVVGGATRGWNSRTESICYTQWGGDAVPEAARKSIRALVDDITHRYGGKLWVKVHRDFAGTSCPGDALADWVANGCQLSVGNPASIDWNAITAFLTGLRASVASRPLSRRRRSRGMAVRLAQSHLRDRGFDVGVVDGIYGKKTRDAVKEFQRSVGVLKADGVIGVRTWDALFIM